MLTEKLNSDERPATTLAVTPSPVASVNVPLTVAVNETNPYSGEIGKKKLIPAREASTHCKNSRQPNGVVPFATTVGSQACRRVRWP